MKKIRFRSMFSALLFMAFALFFSANAQADQTYGYWKYTTSDVNVTITGYTGNEANVIIPGYIDGFKVTEIGPDVFMNNTRITSVVIPATVKTLRGDAFTNCTYLSKITINGNLELSSGAMDGYPPFSNVGTSTTGVSVIFGEGVEKVPDSIFHTYREKSDGVYPKITSVTLSSTITEIGYAAFENCFELKSINLGNATALKCIGGDAFRNCIALQTIVFPKKCTELHGSAFENCIQLNSITIKGNLELTEGAKDSYPPFYNAGTATGGISVVFGEGVETISGSIFKTGKEKTAEVYPKVVSVKLPSTLKTIGFRAFKNCYELKEINLGDASALQTIEGEAFQNCIALKKIVIPKKCTKLGGNAFQDCTYISSITINGNPTASESYPVFLNVGAETSGVTVKFGTSVTTVNANLFATRFSKEDGRYCHIKTVTIPSSVKKIGIYAFINCHDLKTMVINGKNTELEVDSICQCSKLKTIQCVYGSKAAAYAKKNGFSVFYLNTTITGIANVSSGIKLTWNKNTSAVGYEIYRKAGTGAWKKVKTISSGKTVTWTDTDTTNGTKYQYKVYYQYKSGSRSLTSSIKTTYRLTTPSLSSVKSTSAKKVTVKWTKNAKASGYQIKYVKGSTTKTVTVSGASTLSKVLSSLTSKSTYQISVRAYKTVDGVKYYSAYSAVKSVKVK